MTSFILPACGTDRADVDASRDADDAGDAAEECTGPVFECCDYCHDDVSQTPICVNSVRACPAGTVSNVDCIAQNPCHIPCTTPKPSCVSSDGGGFAQQTCDSFPCPSGFFLPDDADGTATRCQTGDASVD